MRLLLRYRFAHAMPKDMPCHTMLCYVLICYALSCHSWLQQPLNWLSVRCPAAVACCCNSRLLIVCCCCYYCRLTNVRVAFTSSTRFIFAFLLYAPFTCEPGFHVVVVIVVVIAVALFVFCRSWLGVVDICWQLLCVLLKSKKSLSTNGSPINFFRVVLLFYNLSTLIHRKSWTWPMFPIHKGSVKSQTAQKSLREPQIEF